MSQGTFTGPLHMQVTGQMHTQLRFTKGRLCSPPWNKGLPLKGGQSVDKLLLHQEVLSTGLCLTTEPSQLLVHDSLQVSCGSASSTGFAPHFSGLNHSFPKKTQTQRAALTGQFKLPLHVCCPTAGTLHSLSGSPHSNNFT